MNGPDTTDHHRAETIFFTERYHRAFEDEVGTARGLVGSWLVRQPRSVEVRGIHVALDTLLDAITAHVALQETHLFPAMVDVDACSAALLATGAADSAALWAASEELRQACHLDPTAKASSTDARLKTRLVHLVDELERHLCREAAMFADA